MDDLNTVLEAEGLRGGADVRLIGVGHSMGASVLLLAALADDPKRRLLLDSLVLFEPVVLPGDASESVVASLAEVTLRRKKRWKTRDEVRSYLSSKPLFKAWAKPSFDAYVTGGFRNRCPGSVPGLTRFVELKCSPKVEAKIYEGRCGPGTLAQLGGIWDAGTRQVSVVMGAASRHLDGEWGGVAEYTEILRRALGAQADFAVWEGRSHFLPMEDPERAADEVLRLVRSAAPPAPARRSKL